MRAAGQRLVSTDIVTSPLLDDRHLHLRDGVVARMEPHGQFVQDSEGGVEVRVPCVDQLRAAVVGGDDLPVQDGGPAV